MVLHFFERSVRVFRFFDTHDFHLVELVQAVQATHVLTVTTGFATEASTVSAVLLWKAVARKNHIAVDVGHRHFGGRNQIEVIYFAVVHLTLLVGELASAQTRSLVHHVRWLNFGVASLVGLVEKELDKRALQACTLANIHREAGTGNLHAEVKVDDVVFLSEFPVWKSVGTEIWHIAAHFFHHVVFRSLSFRNTFVRHVRHREKHFTDFTFDSGEFVVDFLVVGLQSTHFLLGVFGFFFLALLHEGTNLSSHFVELCGVVVALLLHLLALFVEFYHAHDRFATIELLNSQSFDHFLRIFVDKL